MRKVGIGVIGCGVISKAYMTAMKRFFNIELRAVADMRSSVAETRGAEFGVPGLRVDQIICHDFVEPPLPLPGLVSHGSLQAPELSA